MPRKRTLAWLAAALVVAALAVYFEPTHSVRGWLYGEAFFDGRPTSWWRREIAAYFPTPQTRTHVRRTKDGKKVEYEVRDLWIREMPLWEQLKLGGWRGGVVSYPDPPWARKGALAVLLELRDDESATVRLAAREGLNRIGVDPDDPSTP